MGERLATIQPKGAKARDDALMILEAARQSWLTHARNTALLHAHKYGTVTADVIQDACEIPAEWDRRVVGAVFVPRWFRKVGYRATRRREAHARPIAVFVLTALGEDAAAKL